MIEVEDVISRNSAVQEAQAARNEIMKSNTFKIALEQVSEAICNAAKRGCTKAIVKLSAEEIDPFVLAEMMDKTLRRRGYDCIIRSYSNVETAVLQGNQVEVVVTWTCD